VFGTKALGDLNHGVAQSQEVTAGGYFFIGQMGCLGVTAEEN
jgi:hypothetical protein